MFIVELVLSLVALIGALAYGKIGWGIIGVVVIVLSLVSMKKKQDKKKKYIIAIVMSIVAIIVSIISPLTNNENASKNSDILDIYLISDENVSVSLKEFKDGSIVFDIDNNSNNDYYFSVNYLNYDGDTVYPDGLVLELYANQERLYNLNGDLEKTKEYYLVDDKMIGQFEYYIEDKYDETKKVLNFETELLSDGDNKPSSQYKGDINVMLSEDENVAVYLKEIKDGNLVFDLYDKSSDDYYFSVDYINYNGQVVYTDGYCIKLYGGQCREYIWNSFDDEKIEYKHLSEKMEGQFNYYKISDSQNSKDLRFSVNIL